MIRSIIGTGGHIDHGKTALVEALTGVRTDRLPEEQRRGITIDLGFARLDLGDAMVGVVDVPGHEDFIRNMVAGASGFDLLLLVVAADEGVMPQTREHVAIAELLGVPRALVALTKTDLVDPEWLELAREDVTLFLEETRYRGAPVVPVSAVAASGLDELKGMIREILPGARGQADDLFRMPVDRVFTVRGTGTVVTGTVWSGRLGRDQQVRVLPDAITARVRGLQVHGEDVDAVEPGQRAAVALAGIDRDQAPRGSTIVTDQAWQATTSITLRLRVLPGSEWTIEHGQRLRAHLGTGETMARAFLLDRDVLEAGSEAWAQLRFERAIVARGGDRVVVRSYSPVTTIGGGVVAEPLPSRRRRLRPNDDTYLASLVQDDPVQRAAAVVRAAGAAGSGRGRLPVLTGATPAQAVTALDQVDAVSAGDLAFAADAALLVERSLEEALDRYHAQHPLHRGMDPERLRRAAPAGAADALVAHALDRLLGKARISSVDGRLAAAGFAPTLSAGQEALRQQILRAFHDAAYAPPRLDQLEELLGSPRDLPEIVALLDADGQLVRLEHDLFMHRDHVDRMVQDVLDRFGGRTDVSPPEFREVIPASRKHLIPILEYLDRSGVTVRKGEGRAVHGT
jgi:selenocysteine-specific elongation factor